MHVAIFKSGDVPIPPALYGGTERVIYWLGKALVELGHQVTLIANARSHIPGGELRAVPVDENEPTRWQQLVPESADILHLWSTPIAPLKKPFLVTIEGNGQPGEKFHPNTVFVFSKHAANHGSRHFVYNGL